MMLVNKTAIPSFLIFNSFLMIKKCFYPILLPRAENALLHLPEVNRKTRNENSQTNTGEYWIWPGSNAITHFNDSQKMNIATAKVIKLKLHVSVPGWPEKTCPKKPRREKRAGNLGRARHILRPPPGLYILNKLLKITKPAKAKI